MKRKPLAIGIDVSKERLDVAILMDDDSTIQNEVTNDKKGFRRLATWLKKQESESCSVCLEATGRYGEGVAHFLHDKGHRVSVVNPARIKGYRESRLQRNKTDREDAKLIAHFCWTQKPAVWEPPSAEVRQLQELARHLQAVKQDRTRLKNRLQSGITSPVVSRHIKQQIALLDKQIKQLEATIKDHIDQHPTLRQQRDLLISIPGIGHITAALFLAEVPDVRQFKRVKQLVAYAGLSPRITQSGSSVRRRGGLVKTGNSRLRTALYMPALVAVRYNPVIVSFATRLKDRGKQPMVVIGASMRKLLHIMYGVLKNGIPFDPNYGTPPTDCAP